MAKEVRIVETASVNAWPPTTTDYLNGWQLRYSPGVYNRRVNSVLVPFCSSGDNFLDHIKVVEQFYWNSDLSSRFMVSPTSVSEELDEVFANQGYLIEAPTWLNCKLMWPL